MKTFTDENADAISSLNDSIDHSHDDSKIWNALQDLNMTIGNYHKS